mmetsp:Transcript_85667/g.250822  ORF Transcript_85667/g.250822 Transcript_85667/m.250822 type:complete len:239 (+) Transcript_85667:409-1125(+)
MDNSTACVQVGPPPFVGVRRDNVDAIVLQLHTRPPGPGARTAAPHGRQLLAAAAPLPALRVEALRGPALELHHQCSAQVAEGPAAAVAPVPEVALVHGSAVGLAARLRAGVHLPHVGKLRDMHRSRSAGVEIQPPVLERVIFLWTPRGCCPRRSSMGRRRRRCQDRVRRGHHGMPLGTLAPQALWLDLHKSSRGPTPSSAAGAIGTAPGRRRRPWAPPGGQGRAGAAGAGPGSRCRPS